MLQLLRGHAQPCTPRACAPTTHRDNTVLQVACQQQHADNSCIQVRLYNRARSTGQSYGSYGAHGSPARSHASFSAGVLEGNLRCSAADPQPCLTTLFQPHHLTNTVTAAASCHEPVHFVNQQSRSCNTARKSKQPVSTLPAAQLGDCLTSPGGPRVVGRECCTNQRIGPDCSDLGPALNPC